MALIRKHSQVYSTVVIFFNSVAVALAWLFAYLTRFELELFSPAIKTPGENYVSLFASAYLVSILC